MNWVLKILSSYRGSWYNKADLELMIFISLSPGAVIYKHEPPHLLSDTFYPVRCPMTSNFGVIDKLKDWHVQIKIRQHLLFDSHKNPRGIIHLSVYFELHYTFIFSGFWFSFLLCLNLVIGPQNLGCSFPHIHSHSKYLFIYLENKF